MGKEVTIEIDHQLGTRNLEYGFFYPLNYGFIPNFISLDGKPIEAYLLGVGMPVEKFIGTVIAYIHRENGDDKMIIVPKEKNYSNNIIWSLIDFQEHCFQSYIVRK